MIIRIKRNYLEKQTEGLLEVLDVDNIIFTCKVLERPWLENKNSISCIPEGFYPVTKEIQETRGKVLRVHDVNNRTGILFHSGNYVNHSKGCLLPGENLIDINFDGLKDVTNSKNTCNKLYDLLTDDHNYVKIYS